MKQSLKILILVLTLVVPALVYVFLKSYGENRYALPAFYQEEAVVVDCPSFTLPHQVSFDQALVSDHKFIFFIIGDSIISDGVETLSRIVQKYDEGLLVGLTERTIDSKYFKDLTLDELELNEFLKCELLLDVSFDPGIAMTNRAVLLDQNQVIRGFYDISQFDELERIEVEIKILLEEYSYQQ